MTVEWTKVELVVSFNNKKKIIEATDWFDGIGQDRGD